MSSYSGLTVATALRVLFGFAYKYACYGLRNQPIRRSSVSLFVHKCLDIVLLFLVQIIICLHPFRVSLFQLRSTTPGAKSENLVFCCSDSSRLPPSFIITANQNQRWHRRTNTFKRKLGRPDEAPPRSETSTAPFWGFCLVFSSYVASPSSCFFKFPLVLISSQSRYAPWSQSLHKLSLKFLTLSALIFRTSYEWTIEWTIFISFIGAECRE